MAKNPLTKALMVIEAFRGLDAEFPTQIASILLHIARKPGINFKELQTLTGLGKSSVSRNVALLSKEYGKWHLVTMYEDPEDRRNKVAKLTPQGERFVAQLSSIMED
jgi:DNA-binding MarR family transcriptional regulator